MKHNSTIRYAAVVVRAAVLAITVTACGGGGGGGGGGLNASFTSIWENVFAVNCVSACHQPGGIGYDQTGSGLDLSTRDAAYDSLVNVDAFEAGCGLTFDQPCGKRVEPGNPDGSYLIHKLEGTDVSFNTGQMPLNKPPLDQAQIDVIREWILNGALND